MIQNQKTGGALSDTLLFPVVLMKLSNVSSKPEIAWYSLDSL